MYLSWWFSPLLKLTSVHKITSMQTHWKSFRLFLNWLDLYKPNSNHSSRTDSGNSLRLTSPGYSAGLETKQCLEEALQLWQKEHWTRRLLLLASCSQASELKCHFSLYLFPKYTTLAPNPVLLCSTMRLTRDSDTGKRRITKRIVRTNYTWVDFFLFETRGFFPQIWHLGEWRLFPVHSHTKSCSSLSKILWIR